jgi:DNA-binding MarR family transcriptional regulator
MPDSPLTLDAFLPFRLSYTSNLVSDRIARAYQALFGLTIPEWRLVAVIAEEHGITQQAIGGKTRMDKVTVSRAAIALVERNLVERAPNAGDRRSHLLRLTGSGQALYEQVAPKALDLERRMFGGFDAERIAAFVAMLRDIDAVALAVEAEATD